MGTPASASPPGSSVGIISSPDSGALVANLRIDFQKLLALQDVLVGTADRTGARPSESGCGPNQGLVFSSLRR
jgi:hypothetical protein